MLHDGHDYSVIHLVAACFLCLGATVCVSPDGDTVDVSGFGAGVYGELAPAVETGLANLVDLLARAVGTRARHQCGH